MKIGLVKRLIITGKARRRIRTPPLLLGEAGMEVPERIATRS